MSKSANVLGSAKFPTPRNLLSSTPSGEKYTKEDIKQIEYRHKKALAFAEKNYKAGPKEGKGPSKRDLYNIARTTYQKINKDAL